MSDQGWNTPGPPPGDSGGWNQPSPQQPPQQGEQGWGQQPPGQPPPPQQPPQQQWGQQPPPPQQPPQQWGQQPPPPQQAPQQWGQPGQPPGQPGQPQWSPQPSGSGGGLEPNVAAMLAYLLFGWVGGLIMYLTQKHPEVRFHGAQSILLFAPLSIIQFVFSFFITGLTSLALFGLLSALVGLFSFGMWIFMSIQGYQLNHLKLPIIGDMAEQWAAK